MTEQLSQIDTKVVRCLDGLYYAFEILRWSHTRLWETCCSIPQDPSQTIEAINRCWVFVDAVHRIREISQALPTVAKKNPQIKRFLGATSVAATFRNHIQHLRNELNELPAAPSPIWGAISWVDPVKEGTANTLILGSLHGRIAAPTCPYDLVDRRWVSRVSLGLLGETFNFDPAFSAAENYREFILPLLESRVPQVNRALGAPAIFSTTYEEVDGHVVRTIRTSAPHRMSVVLAENVAAD